MGFKILELEDSWKIGYKLDNIIIFFKDKKIPILLNELDILLINNITINISCHLLNELANRNILTIICDEKHIPNVLILPFDGHYNSLKILQNQISWDNEYKLKIWKQIIKLKLHYENDLLKHLKFKENTQEKITDELNFEEVQSIEAKGAKDFFNSLFGKKFVRFDETDDENKFINSILNYGFSIILSAFCRSIVKNGMDTRISLFHKSFTNHFALASDLMEPFRIIIDVFTYKNIRKIKSEEFILSTVIKRDLIKILESELYYNKERMRISLAIDKYIYDLFNNKEFKIEFLYDIY